ncbi:MAG: DUF3109 family protein [Alloprevotella sp.]|nr:DUF3109 family protein [Alloprevotella sp.]
MSIPPLLQIDNVILSADILTEHFCCNLEVCKGACCVEGDSGAPLRPEEVANCEELMPEALSDMSREAIELVNESGVATIDPEGELVTQIVRGKDCVFTCYEGGCCFCALEKIARRKREVWTKPISCALYPIREKYLSNGLIGLNYHRWSICAPARALGREKGIFVYQFLRFPLIRRFGKEWYKQLEVAARQFNQ